VSLGGAIHILHRLHWGKGSHQAHVVRLWLWLCPGTVRVGIDVTEPRLVKDHLMGDAVTMYKYNRTEVDSTCLARTTSAAREGMLRAYDVCGALQHAPPKMPFATFQPCSRDAQTLLTRVPAGCAADCVKTRALNVPLSSWVRDSP
jgi:hypothetical protein